MKRISLFRKILSVAFAAAIVYTVSVREVHYLFSQHEAHEHCENHLHDASHHEDCAVCKFDIATFTDAVFTVSTSALAFTEAKWVDNYQPFNLQSSTFNLSLRGPPSLA